MWLRAALFAAALAIVGTALAAPPAQAAAGEQHCAIPISNPDRVTCFATLQEALDYITGGAEVPPSKGGAGPTAARTATGSALAAAIVPVPVVTWFNWALFLGSSVTWYGLNGNCTTPTSNVDYALSVVPAPYNNWMESFITYSNCWQNDFTGSGFTGTSTGYRGTQAVVANPNTLSSAKWS
jgi:hypothetical protein